MTADELIQRVLMGYLGTGVLWFCFIFIVKPVPPRMLYRGALYSCTIWAIVFAGCLVAWPISMIDHFVPPKEKDHGEERL